MFERLMLRLMGQEEKPPDPFQGEVRGIAYHVDSLPKGFVSIWIDLPRDRMQIEPQRRKRQDERANTTSIDHYTQPIWNCGAQTIDIGFSDDKIEAVIPAYMKKVDRRIAEFIVGLMINIRYEALGEREPVKMTRPWSKAAECTLDLGGQRITFELSSCLIYTDDDPDIADDRHHQTAFPLILRPMRSSP